MKIIRLSTFLDFGGIESKMVNLSTHEDNENQWVFVAINKGGAAEEKILKNGKRVACLNLPFRIPNLKTIYHLFLFFKREKPDVLHASGAEANFFAFIAGKLAGIKTIVSEEIGIPNHSSKAKKIFQVIFKNSDWVIGESKIVIDNLICNYNLNSSKVKVIYNFGIFSPIEARENFVNNSDTLKLIMISRLEPVKNIEGVLNAVKRLKTEGYQVQISIAGTGSLEDELKNRVEKLQIKESVNFLGMISDPYIPLLNADLYILNSHSEGFSNSLVEAMYSGTPSLSTNVGAAPEIIQDGVNGFIVPVNDEEALYEKLNEIIRLSESERNEMGKKGKETIVQNFSLEKHVYELMKIYKK